MAPPRFIKFLGVDMAVADAVWLKFQGKDKAQYSAILDPGIIPAVITALITRGGEVGAGRPKATGASAVAQPLLPTGIDIGNSQDGAPMIYFHFGVGGRFRFS